MRLFGRVVIGGLTVVIAATVLVGVTPVAAQSDDGLRMVADSTYRVLPDEGVVEVEIDYTVTNQVADRRSGGQILQTFFTSIVEIIPTAATDLVARRAGGSPLTMTPRELTAEEAAEIEGSGIAVWEVDLGSDLYFGQSRSFTVSYRLVDGGPRTEGSWARVNPAFAAFPVTPRGDASLASVSVEFPAGFDVETVGETMTSVDVGGSTVLTATEVVDPAGWFALVVGSSADGLDHTSVTVAGVESDVVISSWPGDDEWVDFVERGLVEGVPLLVEGIGVPWPVDGELEVTETIAPALAGYGGWYYEPSGARGGAVIEVGEELLSDLLVHELAHAWFNEDFSGMRWLNEGLAEYFGVRVAGALDDGPVEEFETVTLESAGALDLLGWTDPVLVETTGEIDPSEAFGYSASYQVIAGIAAEIGPAALTEVLTLLFERANPYRPDLDDPGPSRVDWQDALDAFEITGGSAVAEDLFVEWVLRVPEEARLVAREEAQTEVQRLAARDPGWAVPGAVHALLADWRFEELTELGVEISALLDDAQAMFDDAAVRRLALPGGPQDTYEAVATPNEGFATVRAALDEQRTALDRVLRAYEREESSRGFFDRIGLLGENVDAEVTRARDAFESAEYAAAVAAADEVDRLTDAATGRGQVRVAGAVGSLIGALLLGLLVVVFRRRRVATEEPVDSASGLVVDDD